MAARPACAIYDSLSYQRNPDAARCMFTVRFYRVVNQLPYDRRCGHGALYGYMRRRAEYADWGYSGLDINPAMIRSCRQRFPDGATGFEIGARPVRPVDYALYSGTFNLASRP